MLICVTNITNCSTKELQFIFVKRMKHLKFISIYNILTDYSWILLNIIKLRTKKELKFVCNNKANALYEGKKVEKCFIQAVSYYVLYLFNSIKTRS